MSGDDIRMAQRAMKDAKYQKKAAIKTSRGTVSKLHKSICDSRKLQYPLLNCESEKFKNNLFLTSPKHPNMLQNDSWISLWYNKNDDHIPPTQRYTNSLHLYTFYLVLSCHQFSWVKPYRKYSMNKKLVGTKNKLISTTKKKE